MMAKIGSGHLAGFIRQGFKEIAQAIPALPTSIKTVEEPGLAGNPTQQEVVAGKSGQQPSPYRSEPERGNSRPGPEMER
jgi:hypothetical protein